MNYNEYLKSSLWKTRKERFINNSDGLCGICGKGVPQNYEVIHHLHYKTLGRENDEDMMLVHDACHRRIHFKLDGTKINVFSIKRMEEQINLLRECHNLQHIKKIIKKKYKNPTFNNDWNTNVNSNMKTIRRIVNNKYGEISRSCDYVHFFDNITSYCPQYTNKQMFLSELLERMTEDYNRKNFRSR